MTWNISFFNYPAFIKLSLLVLCPPMSHTHSYIVFPVHPPEVNDSVWQWALGCNVGLWAIHTLKGRMGAKEKKAMS